LKKKQPNYTTFLLAGLFSPVGSLAHDFVAYDPADKPVLLYEALFFHLAAGLAILTICGVFALGLSLSLWAVYQDTESRLRGIQPGCLLKRVERIGNMLVYFSVLIPAGYGLLRLPKPEQLWVVILMLIFGCFLMIFTVTNLCLNITKNTLIAVTRVPLTRAMKIIVYGVTYLVFLTGSMLILDGFALLGYILIFKI
jgi:hypothetical protein